MSADRKAVFQHFMMHYHNSFAGGKAGLFEHSPRFVRAIVEAGDAPLAAAALRLDPRLTSTDAGAVAYAIARAVAEDKGLAPYFLDVEMADDVLMVTFEHQADANKIVRTLAEVGKVGVMARPQERLTDSVVSDVYLIAVEPAQKVRESVAADMRARFAESAYSGGEVQPSDGEAEDEQGDKKKAKPKKKDKSTTGASSDCDDNQMKDGMETESKSPSCKALGLDERIFGVEALAKLTVAPELVEAAFIRLLGEAAYSNALSADLGEMHIASSAPVAQDQMAPEAHHAAAMQASAHATRKGAKMRINKRGAMHHMHSAEAGHEHRLIASSSDRGSLEKTAMKHGWHVEAVETALPEGFDVACRDRLIRVMGACGLLEGGLKSTPATNVLDAVNAAVTKITAEGFAGNPADEVVVAVDAVLEKAEDAYALFVKTVVDIKLDAMTEERTKRLVGRIAEAGAKDERSAVAAALTAYAKRALFERGVVVEGDKSFVAAWHDHVTEATKPAPAPVDPADVIVDSLVASILPA